MNGLRIVRFTFLLTYDIKSCIENRNSIQHYDIQKLNGPFKTLIKVNKKSMGLA